MSLWDGIKKKKNYFLKKIQRINKNVDEEVKRKGI